jgi:hypothetical protein
VLEEALASQVSSDAAAFLRAVFSLHDAGEIRNLLCRAGFNDVEAWSSVKTLRLPAPERFLWQYVNSTPLAAAAAHLDKAGRASLERAVVARWRSYAEDGGLVLQVGVTVATASK